ncbi:MAG: hypothetical protein KIT68_06155 [Phycisphaeraceae bacterium]|nr:hypothetical protein [Phycisphaeraceae bacterium]
MFTPIVTTFATLALTLPAPAAALEPATIRVLQFEAKDWSTSARGVSDDGSRVVLDSDGGGWVWSGESVRRLPSPATKQKARAQAISGNGLTIAGTATFPDGRRGTRERLARWIQTGAPEDLGDLPNTARIGSSAVRALSADGSVAVGVLETAGPGTFGAFRWSRAGGMNPLGLLPGMRSAEANGVSADGSVTVGTAMDDGAKPAARAVVWTAKAAEPVSGLPADRPTSAQGVSADGRVIVGNWRDDGGSGYRWSGGTITRLRAIEGHAGKIAGVSGDGRVTVGSSDSKAGQRAVIWGPTGTLYVLDELLKEPLAAAPGLRLNAATAANKDGTVIVGTAGLTDASGAHKQVGFIARLPAPVN